MSVDDDGPTFARATGVVWRVGPGRVLLHRSGVPPMEGALELSGRVAFVWAALDEPASAAHVAERLLDAGISLNEPGVSEPDQDMVAADLRRLVDAGVVTVAGSAPISSETSANGAGQ